MLPGVYVMRAVSRFGLPATHGWLCIAPSVPLAGPCTTANVSSQLSASVAPSAIVTGVPSTVLTLVSEATGGRLVTVTVTVAVLLSTMPSFAL